MAVSALGLLRSKVVAVILGPAGIGLFGLLTSATALVGTVFGLGINASGARQVAAAAADEDQAAIGRVVYTLRRTSLVLGILGALFVLVFSRRLSRLTIGSEEYSAALALLSLLILFETVSGGQTALLRGMRRVSEIAKLRILGALWGSLFAIPLVWFWGLKGVAPALVAVAGMSTLSSWAYARRIRLPRTTLTRSELSHEVLGLVSLGAAFVVTGIMASGVQLGTRTILSRDLGLAAVGQFQAATSLSLVFVDFVLRAMGLDFLPRLAGLTNDDVGTSRLVNEQAEISLLLAGPGILFTVALAPLVIPILYSGRFTEAIAILRWQCLGVLLRVATWPIGYVLVARGLRKMFLISESFAHVLNLGCFMLLTHFWGLTGAALASSALYAIYLPLVYRLVRNECGFRWTAGARTVFLVMAGAYALAVSAAMFLPGVAGHAANVSVCAAVTWFSYRGLSSRLDLPIVATLASRAGSMLRRIRPRRSEGMQP